MIRMSVASTADSAPLTATVSASNAAGPRGAVIDVDREEARLGELRRNDHHREHEGDRRHVDIAAEIVEGHLAARQQRDDGEQRDPGAVDLQPCDPARRHAGIGQDQDDENDRRVHR